MKQYKPLGALKITIQKFYRVTGASTQDRGVTPDIILPDDLRYLKTGEKYMEYSLPWDTVSPTTFTKWPRKGIDLARIKADSRRRVKTEPAFIEIAEEAKLAKERAEHTLQSLNIQDVRKERKEARQLEKKTGEHFHGAAMGSASESTGTLSEKEKRARWIKGISKDPYTDEAMAVLDDVIAEQSAAAAKKNPVVSAPAAGQ
jgi:carboxyl-terminal processing protease